MVDEPVPVAGAVIAPRVEVRDGVSAVGAVAIVGAGVAAALGISGLWNRRR